jgi:KUP system potassium uptake protein
MTLIIVIIFQTSNAIGQAYGVTVCSVMFLTTIMFSTVATWTWNWGWWKVLPFAIVMGTIDIFFWTSNLAKIPSGLSTLR